MVDPRSTAWPPSSKPAKAAEMAADITADMSAVKGPLETPPLMGKSGNCFKRGTHGTCCRRLR
eukprot:5614009-Alexandrium_andersonii.AAC.1